MAQPVPEPRLAAYQRWLADRRGLHFDSYDALWRWSISDLDAFWQSIWDYFELHSPTPPSAVLADERMPGARWFPGAQLNFTAQVLRHGPKAHAAGHPALVFADEAMLARGELQQTSWPALAQQVAALAGVFRARGVQRGDRICAVLAHRPETIVAFLAAASIGAIWSLCSPDMGLQAISDRFRQIEPKLLLACDSARWGGVLHDKREFIDALAAQLPSLASVLRGADLEALLAGAWTNSAPAAGAGFEPEPLPFEHPLWIVYSSGTTGLPKPIVHGHGGIVLELLKGGLHNNLGPSIDTGDRFFWFSTTGWIMWNALLGGLLGGTTVCLYDGSPAGPSKTPDWTTLWRFAGSARASFFGAGAAFFASCLKAEVQPTQVADLSALRMVGSTGSPLSDDCFDWIWQHCPQVDGQPIWIDSISGGTDFAGAFVGGNIGLRQVRGQMQCRWLGAAVAAFDAQGREVIDQVGELVCTRPMPSMPLELWGDDSGQRLIDSYFDVYPGVWRHGDWIRITPDGGAIIYGRSDATINRHGVRMGTAEIYRVVEALPEVLDSLVVDLEYLGRESWMPLFVVLREGLDLDAALIDRLRSAIREALGPRYLPSEILQVAAIPRTLSGKKMELPVKKLLLGHDPASVLNRDAMANAASVDVFVDLARRRNAP